MTNYHNFYKSLARSHSAENLPIWDEIYKNAFPDMKTMINHRQNGEHQRAGIDRSIILNNSKQILVDEKARWANPRTGLPYKDIALEYWSDFERHIPGWVCKPLRADYIAYANIPLGICYLLPVPQLQKAWKENGENWIDKYQPPIKAKNEHNGRQWITISVGVPVKILFQAIGQCLRIPFEPIIEQQENSFEKQQHLFIQKNKSNGLQKNEGYK